MMRRNVLERYNSSSNSQQHTIDNKIIEKKQTKYYSKVNSKG